MSNTLSESQFFGQAKISSILLKITPPVMLAQLIQALYNIVDSFFVGKDSSFWFDSFIYYLSYPVIDDCSCCWNGGRG